MSVTEVFFYQKIEDFIFLQKIWLSCWELNMVDVPLLAGSMALSDHVALISVNSSAFLLIFTSIGTAEQCIVYF